MVTIGGCDITDKGDDREKKAIPVEKITIRDRHGLDITFKVEGNWSNTCGAFSNCKHYKSGSNYNIKMIGRQKGVTCLKIPIRVEGEWTFKAPGPGSYLLRFWQSEEQTLDTVITVSRIR